MENSQDPMKAGLQPKTIPVHPSMFSGRRRGRPKGSLNEANVWRKLLEKKHTSRETGETHTMLEWVIKILIKLVASGDFAASAAYEKYFGAIIDPDSIKDGSGVLLAPQGMTAEEWIAMMEEKNRYNDRIRQEVMREMGVG